MKLLDDYKKMSGRFLGMSLNKYINELKQIFTSHGVNSVLDYGCGNAQPYKKFTNTNGLWGVETVLYDPAIEGYETLPNKDFDAVICVDVLEHIPEDELDDLFEKVFARAKSVVFFTFCNRLAKKTLPNGNNAHCTLHDYQWWMDRISKHNHNGVVLYLRETK